MAVYTENKSTQELTAILKESGRPGKVVKTDKGETKYSIAVQKRIVPLADTIDGCKTAIKSMSLTEGLKRIQEIREQQKIRLDRIRKAVAADRKKRQTKKSK